MATYDDKIKKLMAEMAEMNGAPGAGTAAASNQDKQQTAFDVLAAGGMWSQPASASARKLNHHSI